MKPVALNLLVVLFLSVSVLHAQEQKYDTLPNDLKRMSVSVQSGQPFQMNQVQNSTDPLTQFIPHGEFNRLAFSAGATFRYYFNTSFFLQLHGAYSFTHWQQYDSIPMNTAEYDNGTLHSITTGERALNYTYWSNNFLVGIGGGHETRLRHYVVRAGAEIDYMKYTRNENYYSQNEYQHEHQDTISTGGEYDADYTRLYSSFSSTPGIWAIGLNGHASLEYKVYPSFGIGATLMMGFYFTGSGGDLWSQNEKQSYIQTDSNGASSDWSSETASTYPYKRKQFDFSPLNGQINVVYYFGTPMVHIHEQKKF